MKITYFVLLTGRGAGCDYTIGCNRRWEKIICEPNDLKDLIRKRLDYFGTDRIEKVEAIAISQYSNYTSLLTDIEAERKAAKREEEDEKERALLEKLLKKHGKPVKVEENITD